MESLVVFAIVGLAVVYIGVSFYKKFNTVKTVVSMAYKLIYRVPPKPLINDKRQGGISVTFTCQTNRAKSTF